LILGILGSSFVVQTVVSVLVPIAAASMTERGLLVGLVIAIPSALNLVLDATIAAASDTVGRRGLVLLGSGVAVIACLALARADSLQVLAVAALVFGISVSLTVGPALAYLSEASALHLQPRLQGYNAGVQSLSRLIGAIVVAATSTTRTTLGGF
jgi:MFS family permease